MAEFMPQSYDVINTTMTSSSGVPLPPLSDAVEEEVAASISIGDQHVSQLSQQQQQQQQSAPPMMQQYYHQPNPLPPPPPSLPPPLQQPVQQQQQQQPIYCSDGIIYPNELNASMTTAATTDGSNGDQTVALSNDLIEIYDNLGIIGKLLTGGSLLTIRFLQTFRTFGESLIDVLGIANPRYGYEVNAAAEMQAAAQHRQQKLDQINASWQQPPPPPPPPVQLSSSSLSRIVEENSISPSSTSTTNYVPFDSMMTQQQQQQQLPPPFMSNITNYSPQYVPQPPQPSAPPMGPSLIHHQQQQSPLTESDNSTISSPAPPPPQQQQRS